MKKWPVFELVVMAAVILLLVVMIVGFEKNRDEFQRVCDEANGTTVWDGRQYQCIKKAKD